MNEIYFVDETLRDGPQSLWADRMTGPEMLSIAPTIDRAGYIRVAGPSLNHFIVHLRVLRENPWEKIRLLRKKMPNTILCGAMRTTGCWGFDIQPDSLIELFLERCIANGYRHFQVFDPLHDFSLVSLAVEAERPGGEALFVEKLVVDPARRPLRQTGVMGSFDVLGNVVLLTPVDVADRVHARIDAEVDLCEGIAFGACRLPNDAGLIFKALGRETAQVKARVRDFWAIAREEATGAGLQPQFFWR